MATNCVTGSGADLTVSGPTWAADFNAIKWQSIGEWEFSVEEIPVRIISEASYPIDTEYCISGNRDQESFEAIAYYDGKYDIKQMIGVTADYTRLGANGATWQSAMMAMTGADIAGNYEAGEVVTVTMRFLCLESLVITPAT